MPSKDVQIETKDNIDEIMNSIYSGKYIEKGHKTKGHKCVSSKDEKISEEEKASFLYGEILPKGLYRALDKDHMDIETASVIYDCGAGLFKNVIRIWLQYKNIKRAVGVELSPSRYALGEAAALKLVEENSSFKIFEYKAGKVLKIMDRLGRVLVLKCDNLFDDAGAKFADIVLCNTDFPKDIISQLTNFFSECKKGVKIMTYKKLDKHSK